MSLTRITSDLIKDGTVAVADLASATKTAISGSSASGSVSTRTTALETASGSFSTRITNATASINSISSSQATRTANLVIASSSLSSSVATLKGSGTLQSVATNATPTFAGATITGTLTAQEVHTEFESASVIFSSGSTIFGDTADDIHQMTGSLRVITNAETNVVKFFNDGGDQNRDVMILQGGADAGPGNTRFITFKDGDGSDFGFIQGPANGAPAGISFNTTADTALLTLSGSRVGIGTVNPTSTSQLHVEAALAEIRIKGTNDSQSDEVSHLILEASSDRRAGITIEGDSNALQAFMGRPYDSPNVLAFETSGSERVRINQTGVVGIGTNSMSGHVHTYSDLRYMLYLESTYGTDRKYWFRNDGGTLQIGEGAQGDSQVGYTFDVTNKKLAIGTRSVTAELTVIGQISGSNTATIGPVADNGDALITDGADGGLYSVLTVKENGNSRFNLDFEGAGSVNSLTLDSNSTNDILNIMPDGSIYMGVEQGTLAKNSAHRLSVVNPSGASWISTFAYNSYPTLQLYRTNNFSPGSATANFDATSDTDIIGAINWYGSSDSAHTLGAVIDVRQDGSANTNTPTRMDFYVSPGANISAALLSLDGPTQHVGIGTKAPDAMLHLRGDVDNDRMLHLEHTHSSDRLKLGLTHPSQQFVIANNGSHFIFTNESTSTDHFKMAADGTLTATDTSIGSISDERTKENIQTYSGSLSVINTLRPVTYEWKSDRKKAGIQRGFIAQEVTSSDAYWVQSSSVDPNEPDWEYLDGTPQINTITNSRSALVSKLNDKDTLYVSAIQELTQAVKDLRAMITGSTDLGQLKALVSGSSFV